MKVISRAEAKKKGLKTYYTGKPCPQGHVAEIFVNGRCRTCTLEATAKYRKAHKANGTTKPGNAVVSTNAAKAPVLAPAVTALVRRVRALIEKGDRAADKAEQFYKAAGIHIKEIKAATSPRRWQVK
jgi:hypothetical protein